MHFSKKMLFVLMDRNNDFVLEKLIHLRIEGRLAGFHPF